MAKKVTAPSLREKKTAGERIVCLTAYDYMSAQMADLAGVDLVLVGDSLGNVIMGERTTLGVSLEMVEHHVRAVRNGLTNALLVADLPFGSYGASTSQAIESSFRLMKAGAEAVKLEGDYPDAVEALMRAGVPVMGHVGFTPQSVNKFGGYRVQGRGDNATSVKEMAKRLDDAGVFGIVLELMPAELSGEVTSLVSCPTIGIGAGSECDGEIQVWHDVLGLDDKKRKHTRFFAEGRNIFVKALTEYTVAVRNGTFPSEENGF